MHEAQHSFKELGIVTGEVSVDFKQLMKGKEKSVTGLTGGIEYLFKKYGVDYVKGWGKFASTTDVEVDLNDGGKDEFKAKNKLQSIQQNSNKSFSKASQRECSKQTVMLR